MKKKIIWNVFFIIVVSFSLYSCNKKNDDWHIVDIDVIYKNETNHNIRYFEFYPKYDRKIQIFEVQPNSEKKLNFKKRCVENFNVKAFIFYRVHQECSQILISYDNGEKCLVYNNGEGSTVKDNYNIEETSTNHYELYYTFTEEEYNKAVDCE